MFSIALFIFHDLLYTDPVEGWTFLTNHSHVLLCIADDPEIRLRDIADRVGITERAAQRIVNDLAESGYVIPIRVGRRNRYEVDASKPLRHPIERHRQVKSLLTLLTQPKPQERRTSSEAFA